LKSGSDLGKRIIEVVGRRWPESVAA